MSDKLKVIITSLKPGQSVRIAHHEHKTSLMGVRAIAAPLTRAGRRFLIEPTNDYTTTIKRYDTGKNASLQRRMMDMDIDDVIEQDKGLSGLSYAQSMASKLKAASIGKYKVAWNKERQITEITREQMTPAEAMEPGTLAGSMRAMAPGSQINVELEGVLGQPGTSENYLRSLASRLNLTGEGVWRVHKKGTQAIVIRYRDGIESTQAGHKKLPPVDITKLRKIGDSLTVNLTTTEMADEILDFLDTTRRRTTFRFNTVETDGHMTITVVHSPLGSTTPTPAKPPEEDWQLAHARAVLGDDFEGDA
jgi:hypothetical protein